MNSSAHSAHVCTSPSSGVFKAVRCTITVGAFTYAGLFPSTCAAVIDAMTRFPAARRISVRNNKP